jgi:hypothetical protein
MSYPTEVDNEDEVQCIAVMTPGRQRKKKHMQLPCMQMLQDIATLPPSFLPLILLSLIRQQNTRSQKRGILPWMTFQQDVSTVAILSVMTLYMEVSLLSYFKT